MSTARAERQKQLAEEIERRWRRHRLRQTCFVFGAAALLASMFIVGRAFMPMVPIDEMENAASKEPSTEQDTGSGNEDALLEKVSGNQEKATEAAAGESASNQGEPRKGKASTEFIGIAAVLALLGAASLFAAKLLKTEEQS